MRALRWLAVGALLVCLVFFPPWWGLMRGRLVGWIAVRRGGRLEVVRRVGALLLVLGLSAAAACTDVGDLDDHEEDLFCANEGEDCMLCGEWVDHLVECCGELGQLEGQPYFEYYYCVEIRVNAELYTDQWIDFCEQQYADCAAENEECTLGWEIFLMCPVSCEEFLACSPGH